MGDVMRVVSCVVLGLGLLLAAAGCHGRQPGGERAYVDSGAPPPPNCETTNCHRDATCSETDEGPVCACNDGYSGDGFACADIDECSSDADNCDVNATCTNTAGSFTCTCNAPAWQGDGVTCEDADECADNTDNCSANATCINTVGSFDCECALPNDAGDDDAGTDDAGVNVGDAGVAMDGGINGASCRDIDECATDTDDCDPNATCVNNDNGFTCECKGGYVPTGNSAGHGINGCTFAYCDLTGRWAVRSTLVVSWDNAHFNNEPANAIVACGATSVPTHSWELRDFSYDGETLRVKSKGCGSTVSVGHNLDGQKFGQYIPYSMFDAIDLRAQQARDVPLPASNAQPDGDFVPPYEAITFGMRLPNPEDPDAWVTTTTLPPNRLCSSNEPPCWEDDDRDPVAAPAYTTWSLSRNDEPADFYTLPRVGVFDANRLGACYTLGSRSISRFNGSFDGCDRISGTIDVRLKDDDEPALEAWVQGCRIPSRFDSLTQTWIADPTASFDCYDPARWSTMLPCSAGEVRTLNQQGVHRTIDSTTFEMVRVADDTECPEVRAMFPAPEITRDFCECGGETVMGCN